jgi:hypothetical protein
LEAEAFKRFCGVQVTTFTAMVSVSKAKATGETQTWSSCQTDLRDQVLLTLQYWREYRTYFHITQGWNINESCIPDRSAR